MQRTFDSGHSDWISQIIFDKPEKKIYSAGGDAQVLEWDVESFQVL